MPFLRWIAISFPFHLVNQFLMHHRTCPVHLLERDIRATTDMQDVPTLQEIPVGFSAELFGKPFITDCITANYKRLQD